MTDNTLLVSDASSGNRLAELPWSNMSRSRVIKGAGQLSCALPIDHPAVTRANLGMLRSSPDRDVTLYRDGAVKWNGSISGRDCTFSNGVFNLVAREWPWYFGKRTLEVDKDYNGMDVFDVIRDLVTYMTTKTANGTDGMTAGADILAAIPNLSVDPAVTDAGVTFTFASSPTVYGTDRKYIQDIIDLLASDPVTGFEYRTSYTGSTWLTVQRVLELGQPHVGTTLTRQITQLLASDYGISMDGEQSATRVHGMGSSGPITRQSAGMVANGAILLEYVEDVTNGNTEMATAKTGELRRLLRSPGPTVPHFSYVPDDALPYGFCDLGDTWPFNITSPDILSITADNRRVVEEDVACDVDGREEVTLVFNDQMSDLGA